MILFCSIKMLLIVAFEIPITELKFLNVSLLKAFWYIQTCKSSKVNKRMFVKDFTLESNATKRHPVRTLSSSVFWEIHTAFFQEENLHQSSVCESSSGRNIHLNNQRQDKGPHQQIFSQPVARLDAKLTYFALFAQRTA